MARPGVSAERLLFLFYAAALFLVSCYSPDTSDKKRDEHPEPEKKMIPLLFNADSAYRNIALQVGFGPRVTNTKSHEKCAAFLEKRLQYYGLKLSLQEGTVVDYAGKKQHFTNIMGSYKPESKMRILLCSHWDSRGMADQDSVRKNEPIDGADDGASGVGVLLELARDLQLLKPETGVDILFLDAEDTGQPNDIPPASRKEDTWCLGTQYWAKHIPEGYTHVYGILLDMVGARNAMFAMEGYSMQFAPELVNRVWGIAGDLGYSNYFLYAKGGTITDDHYYLNQDGHIPVIDIINYDPRRGEFGSYHHTHADNMSIIDIKTLQATGQTLLQLIGTEPQ